MTWLPIKIHVKECKYNISHIHSMVYLYIVSMYYSTLKCVCVCVACLWVYVLCVVYGWAYRGQKRTLHVFLYHSPSCYMKQGCSWSLKLTILSRLTGKWALGIPVSAPLCCAGVTGIHSHVQVFTWLLRIWTQVLMIDSKSSYTLGHLLIPSIFKFYVCFKLIYISHKI